MYFFYFLRFVIRFNILHVIHGCLDFLSCLGAFILPCMILSLKHCHLKSIFLRLLSFLYFSIPMFISVSYLLEIFNLYFSCMAFDDLIVPVSIFDQALVLLGTALFSLTFTLTTMGQWSEFISTPGLVLHCFILFLYLFLIRM